MSTWEDWLTSRKLHHLMKLPDDVLGQPWQPTEADRKAAWDLYTELRTRVTTQALPYRSGDEGTALQSLYKLFGLTRKILHRYQKRCGHFAVLSVFMLNGVLRPFTTRWHKLSEAGRLHNEDDCRDFRAELQPLQEKLRDFQRLLGHLAEGPQFKEGSEDGFLDKDPKEFSLGGPVTPRFLPGAANPDILKRELVDVVTRRTTVLGPGHDNAENLVGLAISGGGIRSATFALGVMQCLAEQSYLAQVDYLSTVSGGGYLGSFLSSYLNTDDVGVGTRADQLPFRKIEQNEAPPIRHIRNHSKYLVDGTWENHLRSGGQALYGILTNLLTVCPFIVLLATATVIFLDKSISDALTWGVHLQIFPLTLITVGGLALLVAGLAIVQNLGRIGPDWERFRDWYERVSAWWFFFSVIAVTINLLPGMFAAYHWLVGEARDFTGAGLAFITPPIIGTCVVLAKRYPILARVLVQFFWFSGPLAFVLLYFSLTRALFLLWQETAPFEPWYNIPIPLGGEHTKPWWIFVLIDIGVVIYCFTFINVNLTSPHRYYRDQLSEAYLLKPGPNSQPEANDAQKLSTLGVGNKAPYHLVNAALNLSSSGRSDLRGRDADFFLFSKHFCGSPILGYFPTKNWEALDGHVNLGTAMAISGAAAAPIMGMASIFAASFLLALLNVRLNYWLRDPNPQKTWPFDRFLAAFHGPGPGYLLREMLDCTDAKNRYVDVSDGGHLENLAIYELLRRRCKFIIALDGECDPAMICPSLIQLIRFAEIDFGFHIDIDLSELRVDATGFSKSHYALGKIDYGNNEKGFLLYIKSSLTGNEPNYVLAYKAQHPAFPHESTLNQLYNEDQFEAYRALGHHSALSLFRPELMVPQLGPNPTVKDWFQRLANSLL